jgi:probable HAF family extracellular repeat protein
MNTRAAMHSGIVVAGLMLASVCQAATYYVSSVTITDLGTLGGADATAYDINNRGVIVGQSKNAVNVRRAFRWKGGSMIDVGTPGANSRSVAEGINDDDEVVGTYWGPDFDEFENKGFYWSLGTGVVTLSASLYPLEPFDASYVSMAKAINNQGVIVGKVEAHALDNEVPFEPCYRSLPVRWNSPYAQPSIVHCTEVGEGPNSAADINNSGWIIGYEYLGASPDRGFLAKGTAITHMPAPIFGTNPKASGINESGIVVGSADFGSNRIAVRWNGTGASLWIGTLPGGSYSYASEVNDQYFVSGTSQASVASGGATAVKNRAFLWHADFGMVELPVPASLPALTTSCQANALNNRVATTGRIQVVGGCGSRALRWNVTVLAR